MIDPKKINEVVQNIIDAMPPAVKQLPQDFEKNMRAALQSAFEKMDLVSRAEFDQQTKVLMRSREKLEELAKAVEALEKQSNHRS